MFSRFSERGYFLIDVYEKATTMSWGLLGFITLRELLLSTTAAGLLLSGCATGPTTVFSLDLDIYSYSPFRHQGEYSPLSVVRTEARHPNTAISTVPTTETVLVDSLIKFRAGKNTDDVGINKVGAPYHVPWVWCELVLTFGNGQFKMYGRGSIFPSHAWYFNNSQVNAVRQASDSTFPLRYVRFPPSFVSRPPGTPTLSFPTTSIAYNQLRIYPILTKGAPAWGPQQPLSDESL